ncbi:glyoxalase/bleomycin resistance protein/dioxygenase superfamily protein [Shimia isoporae]|uniref:Glyoxalase/bleomycin resistance protein/dioxygenase superfamily protein n=1 Tax=Shimia isoporae TaxID=647720 RepID=A0A4R1NTP4_9RHOB|nr:VOC family protein [Shimia isoporae]TCL08648.1 glyoxalase/bleomycin resistance protein/dioxygenase superfamily protein [Shimia isoporae]
MSLISVDQTITIAMSVTDRHASAKWYQNMLGFELLYHADEAGWSEMQTNTAGVVIGFGEHTKPAPGNCVPVFGIADLDAGRQSLEQAGVKFDGDTEVVEGMVKTATFYDPDGNALMLAQDLTGGAG